MKNIQVSSGRNGIQFQFTYRAWWCNSSSKGSDLTSLISYFAIYYILDKCCTVKQPLHILRLMFNLLRCLILYVGYTTFQTDTRMKYGAIFQSFPHMFFLCFDQLNNMWHLMTLIESTTVRKVL